MMDGHKCGSHNDGWPEEWEVTVVGSHNDGQPQQPCMATTIGGHIRATQWQGTSKASSLKQSSLARSGLTDPTPKLD